jgi:hypothetical protein
MLISAKVGRIAPIYTKEVKRRGSEGAELRGQDPEDFLGRNAC